MNKAAASYITVLVQKAGLSLIPKAGLSLIPKAEFRFIPKPGSRLIPKAGFSFIPKTGFRFIPTHIPGFIYTLTLTLILTIILTLTLTLTLFPVFQGSALAAGSGLAPWIAGVLEDNREYRLAVREYELGLEELRLGNKMGISSSSISIEPLNSEDFPPAAPAVISYTGQLPGEISFNGEGRLLTTAGGSRLEGYLRVELDPGKVGRKEPDPAEEAACLRLKKNLYQAGADLILETVAGYYQYLTKSLELQRLNRERELQLKRLEDGRVKLARGVISRGACRELELELDKLKMSGERLKREKEQARDRLAHLGGGELPAGVRSAGEGFFSPPENYRAKLGNFLQGLPLETTAVNNLLEGWEPQQAGNYLGRIFACQEAELNLARAGYELQRLERERDWQLRLTAEADYGAELEFSGKVLISRPLYDPSGKLEIAKARLQLERARFTLEEIKRELETRLNSQAEEIKIQERSYRRSVELLQEQAGQLERTAGACREGLVSRSELLAEEVNLLDGLISLLELQEALIKARLNWGVMLSLDNFYR